jgi:TDG/mug DNA glycosylase family protein
MGLGIPPDRWTMTRRECLQGIGRAVPDLVADNLRVLFVGINPSNCSGAAGLHFASPGNRFWPTLHRAGFTDRQLRPDERDELLVLGIGITNLVNRATASAAQVDPTELRAGAVRLRLLVAALRPGAIAVLGKGAYQTAFGVPAPVGGRQAARLEGAPLWILPNPSGLNAHYTVDRLAMEYAQLRESLA